MRLAQYDKCLDSLNKGHSITDIQAETGLQASDVMAIQDGARLPDHILIHIKESESMCPSCHRKVRLPCFACFIKNNKDVRCVDVVVRPKNNIGKPLSVHLDKMLLEDAEDVDV